MSNAFVVRLFLDRNLRRCQGLGRYTMRCRRTGTPVDGAYFCPRHAHQRVLFEALHAAGDK